jgi:hypothetical protein
MKNVVVITLSLIFGFIGILIVWAKDGPPTYESYFNYVLEYPDEREDYWTSGLQGVANNSGYWFFTQETRLWKWPVWHDLNTNIDGCPAPPVDCTTIGDIPQLRGKDHFGDLDYYGIRRLWVPVCSCGGRER